MTPCFQHNNKIISQIQDSVKNSPAKDNIDHSEEYLNESPKTHSILLETPSENYDKEKSEVSPNIPGIMFRPKEGTESMSAVEKEKNKTHFINKFFNEYEELASYFFRNEDEDETIYSLFLDLSDLLEDDLLRKQMNNNFFMKVYQIFFGFIKIVEEKEGQVMDITSKYQDLKSKQNTQNALKSLSEDTRFGLPLVNKDFNLKINKENLSNKSQETYADKLKKSLQKTGDFKINNNKKISLSFSVKDSKDINKIKEDISKNLGNNSDINIDKIVSKDKDIKIFCESTQDISCIKHIIETADNIKDKVHINTNSIKKINPRIIIYGVPTDIKREDLTEKIKEQNSLFADDSDFIFPLFSTKNKDNSQNWICNVNSVTCKKLITKGKILINLSCCSVSIYHTITRCFNCLELFHTKNYCKSLKRCSNCNENHDFKDCTSSKLKCNSCISYNKRFKTNFNIEHSCLNPICPSYKEHQKFLFSKIDFGI